MRIERLILAAFILVLLLPGRVSAVVCIPLRDVVAKMDVIVRGKITSIPETGVVELKVTRYYKGGTGPAHLRAEVAGLGQFHRMDWLYVPPAHPELAALIGDGVAPEGGAERPASTLWYVLPAAVALGLGGVLVWRQRGRARYGGGQRGGQP